MSEDIGHTNPLDMGSMGGIGPGSFFFHGMLDEVRVYNTALSSGNVSTVMGENADAYGATYDYSALGNITYQGGDTAYGYGSSSHVHAVTAVGPNSYTYDANGNMTARGSQTMTWDTENRVSQVTWGGNTTTMTYDGDGRRVKKVEAGVTTVYPNALYEKNVTGSEVTTSYYLGGQLVALRKGSTLEDVHQDHLGSTVVSTTSAGASQSALAYLPYGGARSASGALGTDKKYTGQRLDQSGLYYYGARMYDAALGRFISADTVVPGAGNPQSLNRYSYVLNNPLRYVDPSGHTLIDMQNAQDIVNDGNSGSFGQSNEQMQWANNCVVTGVCDPFIPDWLRALLGGASSAASAQSSSASMPVSTGGSNLLQQNLSNISAGGPGGFGDDNGNPLACQGKSTQGQLLQCLNQLGVPFQAPVAGRVWLPWRLAGSLNKIVQGLKSQVTKTLVQFEKRGTMTTAENDFLDLAIDLGAELQTSADGTPFFQFGDASVSVRPFSSGVPDSPEGFPTLQVTPASGRLIKVRYVGP